MFVKEIQGRKLFDSVSVLSQNPRPALEAIIAVVENKTGEDPSFLRSFFSRFD